MQLQEELEYLNQLIMRMADTVLANLKEALDVYQNYDEGKYYDEINDDIVDQQERMIEEECLNIMIKERPYARDMRRVSGILKLVEDLERLGDQAEDVMGFSLKLKNTERHHIEKINEIVDAAMSMVNDCILCFVKQDVELATDVIKRDDIVDNLYEELIEYLIQEDGINAISSSFAIYTVLVLKYIERIADHAVNIAEWVVYIVNGYYKDKQIF